MNSIYSPAPAGGLGKTIVAQIQHSTRSRRLRAALHYGAKDKPVFPCARKRPRTENGYLDATTDPRRIHAWWNRWPDANIAVPTGAASGWWVLDEDPDEGGTESLAALEAEYGALPDTWTVRTPRGGRHYYFRVSGASEGIRNSAGKLGPGLDVRGEGGYVLVPPSRTDKGAYEAENRVAVTDAPEWLVRLAKGTPESRAPESGSERPTISVEVTGPPIPYGQRADTLTRIAGRLHDGTRTPETLAADLMAINRARCEPPIGEHPEDRNPGEVAKIAMSISNKPPCSPGAAKPNDETLATLLAFEVQITGDVWSGHQRGGLSLLKTLIKQGRRYAKLLTRDDGTVVGPAVNISTSQLALAAGMSLPTAKRWVKKLRAAGYIRRDDAERRYEDAGTIVLLVRQASQTDPTPPSGGRDSGGGGITLCRPSEQGSAPWTAPRARHSRPVYDYGEYIGHIRRMGKGAETAVDLLEQAGGRLHYRELAEAMHIKRPRSLFRSEGWLVRLEDSGVVEVEDGYISLTEGWFEAYNARRERDLEIADYQRDLRRYQEQTRRFREIMREGRSHSRAERLARIVADASDGEIAASGVPDGYISELEPAKLPEPEPEPGDTVEDPQAVIAALVREGMSPEWAAVEVLGGVLDALPYEPRCERSAA